MQEVTGWLGGSEPPAQLVGPVLASARPLAFNSQAATGIPEEDICRSVRVYLSSNFRDMQGERDELARTAFPALQQRFRARGVELLLVDLRWGVTEEELALEVCLSEVQRCKPWFIGILGECYGTGVTDEVTGVLEAFPALRGGIGCSLVELEIAQALLPNPEDPPRALFFERDPAWLERLNPQDRPDFEDDSEEARRRLASLKRRIAGAAQIINYAEPAEIGVAVEAALGALLEARFPANSAPDAFTRAHRLHAAYARERLGCHAGAERYLDQLDVWVADGAAPALLITGPAGAGKSALMARWLQERRGRHPDDILFAHYTRVSRDSANPAQLLRRLWEHLNRATGETRELPPENVTLMDLAAALTQRLTCAAVQAQQRRLTIVVALDGLDALAQPDLRWLPQLLPPNVKWLTTSGPEGPAWNEALARGWRTLELVPLELEERRALVSATLRAWGERELPRARVARLLAHPEGGLPLFLTAALQELLAASAQDRSHTASYSGRVADTLLADPLADPEAGPLAAPNLARLYVRVLERAEKDCGEWLIRQALCAIWASRAGVEEADLIALTEVTPLAWARLRNSLGRHLRDREGRLALSQDALRSAIEARYLAQPEEIRAAHLMLADQLALRPPDLRQAEELPHQLLQAEAWELLGTVLLDLERFALLRAAGDAQLLGYWQALIARGASLEELLCGTFWARVSGRAQWSLADIELAIQIDGFLRYAGATGVRRRLLSEELTRACTEILGPQDPWTQASVQSHAQLLWTLGDLEGAQQRLEPLRLLQLAVQGPDDPATLATLSTLSALYLERGELGRCLPLAEQLLEAHTRLHGELSPAAVNSADHLAAVLQAQGDLERAQHLTEGLLEPLMRQQGAEHPDTFSHMERLAQLLAARGQLARAQPLHEQALALRTRVLGAEHPGTLACAADLAELLVQRGDLSGAHKHQERLLEENRQRLGPEHPGTLESLGKLAQTLLALGDYRGARALLAPALPAMMRKLGPEHRTTLASMGLLAAALHARGELEAARKMGVCAVQGSSHVFGPEHPQTLAQLAALTETLLALREIDAAQPLIEQLLADKSRRLGPGHPDTLQSMSGYVEALQRAGGLDAGQQLQERLVERHERHFGPEHPGTLKSKAKLGGILVDRGDLPRAAALLEQVLALMHRTAPEDPDTLASTGALASILAARGKLDEARKLEEQVLAATARHLGPAHPETVASMRRLAQALTACDNVEGLHTLIRQLPASLAQTAELSHTARWCKPPAPVNNK